jgi:hypothetical protein
MMKTAKKSKTIHKMRIVAGFALVGSVLTGAFLGWVPTPFDVRFIGAGLGAAFGAVSVFHLA